VKIYLDDLQKILNVYESNSLRYTIDANEEYKFETLDDLLEHYKTKKIKSLEIASYHSHISIKFSEDGARLFIGENDLKSTAIFHLLNEIVAKCKKPFSFFYNEGFRWMVIPLFIGAGAYSTYHGGTISITALLFTIFCFILFYYCYMQASHKYSEIYLFSKEDQPGFIKRNGDKILLVILGGVLTALFRVVFDLIKDKYFK